MIVSGAEMRQILTLASRALRDRPVEHDAKVREAALREAIGVVQAQREAATDEMRLLVTACDSNHRFGTLMSMVSAHEDVLTDLRLLIPKPAPAEGTRTDA